MKNKLRLVSLSLGLVILTFISRAADSPFLLSFNLYPNPATGDFYLIYRSEEPCETLLEILNAEGDKIYSENLHSQPGTNFTEIKNSTLTEKGVYFVRLSQGKVKSHTERIIKK